MLKQNKQLNLTNREMDVLNVLWSAEKSLVASEITKADRSLTINTVQAVLRSLLKKNLIEIAEIVYSGTVLCRSYRPTITSKDFTLQQFVTQFENLDKSITPPNFVAALLEREKNEESVIEELEKLLQERKRQLKGGIKGE
ncbi:BlaI/MecI/CopY family transcriptional regulator [Clostridium sp. Marseille-P2415]|uniref:BlaI/MecI/CopY family transcriptional regulator n=1 Tax=Clostridium sp. Marseille-P2415 TaxID=1805471 RepID=UPI00098870B4|nr:BlaI/MecI/CopY family transcriptional regulator [Clostridium sp. Marseille-P2415]